MERSQLTPCDRISQHAHVKLVLGLAFAVNIPAVFAIRLLLGFFESVFVSLGFIQKGV